MPATKEAPAKFHKFLKDDAKANPKKETPKKKAAAKKAVVKKAAPAKKPVAKKATPAKKPVAKKAPAKKAVAETGKMPKTLVRAPAKKSDAKTPDTKTGKGTGRGGKRENSGRKSLESLGLSCRKQIRAYVDDKTQAAIIAEFGSLKAWGHSLDKKYA